MGITKVLMFLVNPVDHYILRLSSSCCIGVIDQKNQYPLFILDGVNISRNGLYAL